MRDSADSLASTFLGGGKELERIVASYHGFDSQKCLCQEAT